MTQNTFSITRLIGGGGKGIRLVDGTHMLQRQGCSSTINGKIGAAFLEVRLAVPYCVSELFYEDGDHGPQHNARGRYSAGDFMNPHDIIPGSLVEDALNWIEATTRRRPGAIRQQIHAYMFGFGTPPHQHAKALAGIGAPGWVDSPARDLLLLRFRYDSGTQSVIDAQSNSVVAKLPETSSSALPGTFDPSTVEVTSDDAEASATLLKALRIGFHQCDTRRGSDYCMRRLTWLAAALFQEAYPGREIEVFVLADDAETPASLVEPTSVRRIPQAKSALV